MKPIDPDKLPSFISAARTARLVGFKTTADFLRELDDLVEFDEFPQPMPGTGDKPRFRSDQVLAYRDRSGLPLGAAQTVIVEQLRA